MWRKVPCSLVGKISSEVASVDCDLFLSISVVVVNLFFKGQRIAIFPEHKSIVQGVACDPQHQLIATMCSDRWDLFLAARFFKESAYLESLCRLRRRGCRIPSPTPRKTRFESQPFLEHGQPRGLYTKKRPCSWQTTDRSDAVIVRRRFFLTNTTWIRTRLWNQRFRCLRIYNIQSKNCIHNVSKLALPNGGHKEVDGEKTKPRAFRMFHDDTMKSFFRRLSFRFGHKWHMTGYSGAKLSQQMCSLPFWRSEAFSHSFQVVKLSQKNITTCPRDTSLISENSCSPDGMFLVAPAGCIERNGEEALNTTYIFTRNCLTK